jgi:hypothetical protein
MIHGVFGKLGAGKGLAVMDMIAEELLSGFRDIVTNVPVMVVPWVNGQGIPQIGLRAYLHEKLGSASSEDVLDHIIGRLRIMLDIDDGADLYMWRRDGDTGEWFKLEVSKFNEKGLAERFDASVIKSRHCQPVMVVTDEAWQFFPNNGGWQRAPILTFYSKQQRKLKDEWFIVTQHPSDVDQTLWNIAQDFWVCRNMGMERLGMFRKPAYFSIKVYLTIPTKSNPIFSHEIIRRLDKRLSQCYDTTAGVGFSGGHAGDAGQKRKGFNVLWILIGVVVLLSILAFLPHFLGKGAGALIRHTLQPQSPRAWSGMPVVSNVVASGSSILPQMLVPAHKSEMESRIDDKTNGDFPNVEPVYMAGWAQNGGKFTVMLTDGRQYESGDGELGKLAKTYCVVNGQRYDLYIDDPRKRPPQNDSFLQTPVQYVPAVQANGYYVPPRPVNQIEIIPFGNRRQPNQLPPEELGNENQDPFQTANQNQTRR